jgi:hypothetical protein
MIGATDWVVPEGFRFAEKGLEAQIKLLFICYRVRNLYDNCHPGSIKMKMATEAAATVDRRLYIRPLLLVSIASLLVLITSQIPESVGLGPVDGFIAVMREYLIQLGYETVVRPTMPIDNRQAFAFCLERIIFCPAGDLLDDLSHLLGGICEFAIAGVTTRIADDLHSSFGQCFFGESAWRWRWLVPNLTIIRKPCQRRG